MKSFQGLSKNIDQPVIGRIIREYRSKWFNKKKYLQIFLITEPKKDFPKADAYIISGFLSNITNLKVPYIEGLSPDNISELNEGDIVLIKKDGKLDVVYEINSNRNAILTTNHCNLKCLMCPQPPSTSQEDLLNFDLSLIKMMDPNKTSNLAITGGEPTLIGDGLFKLIETCKKYLPRTSLIILSNGKKFRDLEFVRKLAILGHPNLVIAIPLYSDIDKTHDNIVGVEGSFYETVKGLYNLALFRQRVEIRTVIHALNYKRLSKFAEFVYRNLPFAVHIAFMGMETIGSARENIEQLWIDPIEYVHELKKGVQHLHRSNMNISIYNHQFCILPKSLWPFCRKSISEWKNIYLEECLNCVEKIRCGGFFKTNNSYFSKHIHPITC